MAAVVEAVGNEQPGEAAALRDLLAAERLRRIESGKTNAKLHVRLSWLEKIINPAYRKRVEALESAATKDVCDRCAKDCSRCGRPLQAAATGLSTSLPGKPSGEAA